MRCIGPPARSDHLGNESENVFDEHWPVAGAESGGIEALQPDEPVEEEAEVIAFTVLRRPPGQIGCETLQLRARGWPVTGPAGDKAAEFLPALCTSAYQPPS